MGVILLLLLLAVLRRLCFEIISLICKLPFCLPMRLGWVVTRCAGARRTAPVQTGTALRARRLDWSKPVYVAYLVLQDVGSNSGVAGDWLLLCFSHARHCLRLENCLGVANIT